MDVDLLFRPKYQKTVSEASEVTLGSAPDSRVTTV